MNVLSINDPGLDMHYAKVIKLNILVLYLGDQFRAAMTFLPFQKMCATL